MQRGDAAVLSISAVLAAVVICAGAGFMLALAGLAYGWSALIGFNIIFFAMALGSLSADIIKFISYRRGY